MMTCVPPLILSLLCDSVYTALSCIVKSCDVSISFSLRPTFEVERMEKLWIHNRAFEVNLFQSVSTFVRFIFF